MQDASTSPGVERFGCALVELEQALDWELLGQLYCDGDGRDFFSPEQREAQQECGLLFCGELGERLGGAPGGRSLYVGAALFELPLLLCETLVLGRRVSAVNLEGAECAELNRALALVEERTELELPRIATTGLDPIASASCDHGWMVSVLTDPECFPAQHDALYERSGELATGTGDLQAEARASAALLDAFLSKLAPGAQLTTTDEELVLVRAACARAGRELRLASTALLSGIVGDPVRAGRLLPR